MEKENNIFALAQKELSQDAVIAWLLHGKNGKDFLKNICPSIASNIGEFEIEDVILQKESIDILVEIRGENNSLYAVIIEDKTDTYLHNYQMLKYIEKITNKGSKKQPRYQKVFFVLFKTGDIFSWEKDDYMKRKKQINTKPTVFRAKDLNVNLNGIFISDSYLEKDIVFNENVNVFIQDIYTLNKFKAFINSLCEKESNPILNHYQEYLNNKLEQHENRNEKEYCCVKNAVYNYNINADDEHKIELVMAKPGGGGKREYEYNLLSKYMFNCAEQKTGKVSDNFLILPHIVKNKNTYSYKLNCQIIVDKNKVHGYVPWAKMSKEQRAQFTELKRKVAEICENKGMGINKNFNKDSNEDENNNRLQFYSADGELTGENIINLINLATEISNEIRKS